MSGNIKDMRLKIDLKKTIIVILLLVIIAGSTYFLRGYFYKHEQALTKERESLTATGTVEATTVMASFKVAGRINALAVNEGDMVTQGQELGTLDTQELDATLAQAQGLYQAAQGTQQQAGNAVTLTDQTVEAQIAEAQATVAKAQVGVTNAKQTYDRVKELLANGGISQSDYDQANNNYQAAQSDLAAAQGKLREAQAARQQVQVQKSQYAAAAGNTGAAQGKVQEARTYLANTHLKSPMAGYITQRLLEPGEIVNAGTPVFEITDLKHTYVKVYIPENKISRVHLNQIANVKVDAYPDRTFRGKVVWINDAGDFAVHKAINDQYNHDIRSFEVKIDLPNDSLVLKTGMTATVKIASGEK